MRYKDQQILLASKHAKEIAIAPCLQRILSANLLVKDFDTDKFGTFTGEIERKFSPYETCILKAKAAANHYGYKLALASEGSFGPHPFIPFVASDHEIMVFVDLENDWVISEQIVSEKTNYAALRITSINAEIYTFLDQVLFPSHALIVQATASKQVFAKGITDTDNLLHYINLGFETQKELLLVTDMRAMMNPSRMKVIADLANKLALRIATACSQCGCPGFGFKTTYGSLPCTACGAPTSIYAQEVWGCIACSYEEYKDRSDGLKEASPMYCNFCNP